MEMVPSSPDVSPWQWLGQASVTLANVQSIASVSSGAHREQSPHKLCSHLPLYSYRTNAWEMLGTSGLSAHGRTAVLLFCKLTAVPCLFRYICYAKDKESSTWHFLCLTDRLLCSLPCMCWSWTIPSSQESEDIKSLLSILKACWSGICSAVIGTYCIKGLVRGCLM